MVFFGRAFYCDPKLFGHIKNCVFGSLNLGHWELSTGECPLSEEAQHKHYFILASVKSSVVQLELVIIR